LTIARMFTVSPWGTPTVVSIRDLAPVFQSYVVSKTASHSLWRIVAVDEETTLWHAAAECRASRRTVDRYRSVQEQHGSTDAWMSGMSASCWPTHMAPMDGMFTKDGVRILTRVGVSLPSEAR